jgi:hypothetical protein
MSQRLQAAKVLRIPKSLNRAASQSSVTTGPPASMNGFNNNLTLVYYAFHSFLRTFASRKVIFSYPIENQLDTKNTDG